MELRMVLKQKHTTIALFLLVIFAFILWYIVFVVPRGNFWIKLSAAAAILAMASLFFQGGKNRGGVLFKWQDLLIGIGSAAFLYFIFWLGKLVLSAIFPSSGMEIQAVYNRGDDARPVLIAVLLLLVTSPAEEIFWRGFIQKKLAERTTSLWGLLLGTILYAGVHIWTFNITLILAALAAGFFWGLLYKKTQRLLPVIISHALWTTAIFVLFPMG